MGTYHIPVMLKEVIEFLNVQKGEWYVDCNLGGGGHTQGILNAGGKVLGIDLDPDAINEVARKYNLTVSKVGDHLQAISDNLILYQSNFTDLKEIVESVGLKGIKGILFDLGVSSYQLETAERGFSFNADAPLDMRMNPSFGPTAADLLNALYEKELADLFWKYGEENFSRPIARRIVEYRKVKPIQSTNELANIVLSVRHRGSGDRTHPATRVFQALRIAVNDELNSLKTALPQAIEVLDKGGRVAVISFHSLEDRIAKDFFNDENKNQTIKLVTKKPIEPSDKEVLSNPRSRSGKLRIIEKI